MLIHDDIVPALIHIDYVQIGNKPNRTLADIASQESDNDFSRFLGKIKPV